eukprot:2281336-Pyramimonas_sp.AAC.1
MPQAPAAAALTATGHTTAMATLAQQIIPTTEIGTLPTDKDAFCTAVAQSEGVATRVLDSILETNNLSTTSGRDKPAKVGQLLTFLEREA